MAVLARDRKVSSLEFYRTAVKLRKSLYYLMMRDFGAKDKVRDPADMTKGMDPQDADLLIAVYEKYHIQRVPMEWPEWLIVKLRDSVCDTINGLMVSLQNAMSVWPTTKAEYDYRRVEQDKAIGCCNTLLETLTFAVDVLPVDIDKYKSQVALLDKERALIKGWRKADNKRFKSLK